MADGQEHNFDLKGLDSERISRDLMMGIKNAEKRYFETELISKF